MRPQRLAAAIVGTVILTVCACGSSQAATFTFGGLAGTPLHGFEGDPEDASAQLTVGEFTLNLAAGPTGARLAETGSASGLGVSSGPIMPGVVDGGFNVFDILKGSLAGTSEFIRFSFDEPGILTGINFDGISDDALEYFVLESPGRISTYFFDVDSNNTVAGAVDRAIDLGIVDGHVVYMLDDPPGAPTDFNDEIYDLVIPFAAGQEFTLTYRELSELGPGYAPALQPNGARFQQFVVAAVPEPATYSLLLFAAASIAAFGRSASTQIR